MANEVAVYPVKYEKEVLLKDGSTALIRPIKPDDVKEWVDFINRISVEPSYAKFRYFPQDFRVEQAERFCRVDYRNTFAFVTEINKNGKPLIVSVGRYYRLPRRETARVAFITDEAYRGRGIGNAMMAWLATVAKENGITSFKAEIPADEGFLDAFKSFGFNVERTNDSGVTRLTVPLARTKALTEKEEARESETNINSIHKLLYPHSIAVIGASRDPKSLGNLIFKCIMQNNFSGVVYPVNPTAESIMSVKSYPSVIDIPGPVDLGLIVVPAKLVSRVADECGRKGVKSLIVISDGFKERGPEGAAREKDLRDIAFGHGMRLVGPNCMGVINTDLTTSMNATFSPIYPPAGNVAFLSQSGAMGLVVLEYASSLNMGISSFVSVGNRADVSPNDMLEYWGQDPRTDVILLYLEAVGNARRFSRIARAVSPKKPILVVKGGRTPAGSHAASSHTGSLAASSEVTDALFREAGIVRVNAIEELFDVAGLLANQPIPAGRRVAIVTNGGGPGIIAADACSNLGLELSTYSPESLLALKAGIKRDVPLNNPLDLTAGAGDDEFEHALRVTAADPGVDAALLIFAPPILTNSESIAHAIARVAPAFQKAKKPLMACFMGQRGVQAGMGVPCYLFPESAINALARAIEYDELRKKIGGKIPKFTGIKREKALKLIDEALTRSTHRPLWLSMPEIAELLACYGIKFAEIVFADTPESAAQAASKAGFPVAIKLASDTISHKSDVGGVILDVNSEAEVKAAFKQIKSKLAAINRAKEMQGVTIQRMVKGGIEAIVGVTQDPSFGPVIMFGIGGVYTELIKDVAIKLHPLTDSDAHDLVHSIKMTKLFEGFRGAAPSDTSSVEDLLLRLSAMVEDIPQISELDFNPVKVMPDGEGYWIVDARIMLK